MHAARISEGFQSNCVDGFFFQIYFLENIEERFCWIFFRIISEPTLIIYFKIFGYSIKMILDASNAKKI